MPGRRPDRRNGAALGLALAFWGLLASPGLGDDGVSRKGTPTASPAAAVRKPFPTREEASRRSLVLPESSGSGTWWFGSGGVALALAGAGWASVAARKHRPGQTPTGVAGLKVVGRTSLSPRHQIYLLKAGDRVLIVGTGPQGAPSLLGELDPPAGQGPASRTRLDFRLGDES